MFENIYSICNIYASNKNNEKEDFFSNANDF